jgi:8-oxo-dGTP pyrophosphatase MutT (NUDIX family)
MHEYVKRMRSRIGHEMLILVGVSVYVYQDGKVLMQKRSDNQLWCPPGGIVEIGETLEETGKRELFEETGLIANSMEFYKVYSGKDMIRKKANGDESYIIGSSYICEDFTGILIDENEETLELKWYKINEPFVNISPPAQRPLKDFIEYIRERDKV